MTQSYELFANRHLRRINDTSSRVHVNTKYELTAANTNKLWFKFEEELLGRQANIDRYQEPPTQVNRLISHQQDKPLHSNDLLGVQND